MTKILRNKKIISVVVAVLVLGGGLWISRVHWFGVAKSYDLALVQRAKPILTNEVKQGGPLVIVNFWASWCPPCISETPSMLNYAKNNSAKVRLYLVSEDSSSQEIRDFIKAFSDVYSVNLRIIWDADRKIGENFKVHKMPETFIFDNNGKLLRQFSGSMDWSEPELQKILSDYSQN